MSAPCDVDKVREIVFHPLPPEQVERALELLGDMPGLKVTRLGPQSLQIAYCIGDHCLQDIETMLGLRGFHLEATLLIRVKRALAYYCEHVQRENMHKPEVLTKKYKPHMEAWEKHPHGDHDETPTEWRQYK
ncbi:MAG: hypothetical protein Q8O33_10200 [Pseudomonadota bacterium]|nr:hypothetical protein [Pseudomonadota bacterium]